MQNPENQQVPQKQADVIDKSIYSHGEPMEISENVAKDGDGDEQPMEVCKNGCVSDVVNGVDGSGMSSDEMTPEESSRMEKAYKTRRRRKEVANSYL